MRDAAHPVSGPRAMILNDPAFLIDQYRDASNLEARIALHARFSTAAREFVEWAFDHYDLPAGARILELGCGNAVLWTKNRDRIPKTWRVILSDFSLGMVEAARATGLAAEFAQIDAQAIPFPDEYFDTVIANHMLFHVPNIPRALAEFARVLQVGGRLYATTSGRQHMCELDELNAELGIEPHIWAGPFCLENGAEQLAPYFADVKRYDHQDELVVTDVEPLVAYMKSTPSGMLHLTQEREQRLRDLVSEHIARRGAFHITKVAGLFESTK